MNLQERAAAIAARLVDHLHEIGAVPQPMTKFEWMNAKLEDPSNLHRMYGWVPPFVADVSHPEGCGCTVCCAGVDAETVVAPFCPELIAEQSEFLDDDLYDAYMDTIHWSLSMHILYRHMDWQEREIAVDKKLLEIAEDSMQLQNDVQMRILEGLRS